jgi:putative transposase
VKRAVVDFFRTHFGLSIRRSCRLALLPRSTYLYEKQPNGEEKILAEMKTILSKNTKYGSGMVHLKLRQQGLMINHKRVERIYRENNLQLPVRKRRKKIAATTRVPSQLPEEPGKLWTMDFVSDSVAFNRKFKILTTLDPVTNVSPVIHPGYSITGKT